MESNVCWTMSSLRGSDLPVGQATRKLPRFQSQCQGFWFNGDGPIVDFNLQGLSGYQAGTVTKRFGNDNSP